MTGYNVRIFRDGAWQNLDLVELTDEEFDAFAKRRGDGDGWSFAKALANWIRANVREGTVPDQSLQLLRQSLEAMEARQAWSDAIVILNCRFEREIEPVDVRQMPAAIAAVKAFLEKGSACQS